MSHQDDQGSYGQILKSTALVGGSQVVSILMGIIRVKFNAVLLGPAGVGLMGVYNSIIHMINAIAGLGIGSSSVRQVAEAASTGDQERTNRTVFAVRRLSLLLGLAGALIMVLLSMRLSRLSFGNTDHGTAIAILSVTIFFGVLSAGQVALLQGLRRVADIATLTIIGSFLGTLFSIPLIYLFRKSGIVPFLIIISALQCAASWWFSRRVPLTPVRMAARDMIQESRKLIGLGLAFMGSGVMTTGVAFLIRAILTARFDLEGVGLYQAAYTLSGLYIGIILHAMGMDYYPRLTAASKSREASNQLINQQTEIGLLMAAPAIIATLFFAPTVIKVFYSARFTPAFEILQWQILGVFLRVISWPIGFLILAKGKALVFFLFELASNLLHLGLITAGIGIFGLKGTGIAFFGLYLVMMPITFAIGRYYSGFSWSKMNLRLFAGSTLGIVFAIVSPHFIHGLMLIIFGTLLTSIVAVFCIRRISVLVGPKWFTSVPRQIAKRLRFIKGR